MLSSNDCTVVYTECDSDRSGDSVMAAETAYALKIFTASIQPGHQFILVSGETGVKRFQKLYGTESPTELNVHGEKFEVMTLQDFIEQKRNEKLTAYIEVANCKPASPELVGKLVEPMSLTKALFIGLPHYPTVAFDKTIKGRYPKLFQSGNAFCLSTGIGSDRIGTPIYTGEVAALDHEKFNYLTKEKFGLVYYFTQEGVESFISDYLISAHYPPFNCTNFVLIGQPETALKGIKECITNSHDIKNKKVLVFNPEKNTVSLVESSSGEVVVNEIKLEEQPKDAVRIIVYSSVPHEQMRALIKNAIAFIGVTGIASWLESFYFQKIPLYQVVEQNKFFVGDHYKEHMKCTQSHDKTSTGNILTSLTWRRFYARRIGELLSFFKNQMLCEEIIKTNAKLVEDRDHVAQKICLTLGLFSIASTNKLEEGNIVEIKKKDSHDLCK